MQKKVRINQRKAADERRNANRIFVVDGTHPHGHLRIEGMVLGVRNWSYNMTLLGANSEPQIHLVARGAVR
jgi:hypothetical protein